jgi:rhamnosyltransferase
LEAQSVCAVIITYHPSAGMLEQMSSVLAQTQGLVVVDNGSDADELGRLRTTSRDLGFHLIENRQNLGVAEALNQGVRWAQSKGFPWVILFDQDSRVTGALVGQLFAVWESHPKRNLVASIHPKYVDPDTGFESPVRRASDGGPVVSLTSGALMPVWIFDKVGWFASEYFIDCVDFEYCLRIRAAGFLIADSREAVLLHAAGHADKNRSILGFRFRPTHYSTTRRYYMSRNRVVLYREYFSQFPGWVLQSMSDSLRETIKCFVGDEDRREKFSSFVRGTWDGLRGKMGERETGSERN